MVEQQEKVIRMEDILNTSSTTDNNKTNSAVAQKLENKNRKKSVGEDIPRGKPKSGRIWKEPRKRFSSIVKTRGLRLSLAKKQKLKEDLKKVQEMSRAIKERKQAEKDAKKQRRIANLKRAEENRKKSEIVQVIKNTAKIKKMKKKQLKLIEKRDTTKM